MNLLRAVAAAAATDAAGIERAYPILTRDVISEELHVGTESVFSDAGLVEVSRPTKRRVVMRIDF